MSNIVSHASGLEEFEQDLSSEARHAGRVNDANRHNQVRMLQNVALAQMVHGGSRASVARRLGVEESVVEDAVSGRTDLSLTEMRMLFGACDVVVDYVVRPARLFVGVASWVDRFQARAMRSQSDGDESWEDVHVLLQRKYLKP